MKLLLVTPYFYPKIGGLENYAYHIAKGLHEKYHWEIVVITSNHTKKKYIVEEIDGLKIYRLPLLLRISNTPINPFWYFSIKKIIKKEKPDIINAHTPVPFIADLTARVVGSIPFVVTYHAGTMKKEQFLPDLLIYIYEKIFLQPLLHKANTIICCSKFVQDSIAKQYASKSIVMYPAVDTDIFTPSQKEKKDNIVLFVGRHANVYALKGLYYLMEAMREIPDATLKIVGEKIAVKQKNAAFVGIKTDTDLAKEMQKSSVLVLPSLQEEGFGIVLIEAMACKIPVIGTRVGGIPELIDHGKNGLLVSKGDVPGLVHAIMKIINNGKLAKAMGEYGYQKIINNFTWDEQVKKTHAVLSGLL